jgi:hypothetical protein
MLARTSLGLNEFQIDSVVNNEAIIAARLLCVMKFWRKSPSAWELNDALVAIRTVFDFSFTSCCSINLESSF